MVTRIDDLFSPERLRGNWQRSKAEVPEPTRADMEAPDSLLFYSQLKDLINDRFQGDEALVFKHLLERLEYLLVKKKELGEETEHQNEVAPAINDVLNRIEDLVEAFQLIDR